MPKKILTKETFCEYLDKWRAQDEAARHADTVLSDSGAFKSARDFFSCSALAVEGRQDAMDLLAIVMDDEDEWIEYFVFELDYGRAWNPGMVTDADGSDIDLSSAEKLYELLVSEQQQA